MSDEPSRANGVRLDLEEIRAQLHNLYLLATRDLREVEDWPPVEYWRGVIRQVAAAPARTYLASLATGLVARSTTEAVDATALMQDAGPGGYSAASVARELIAFCAEHGINLRNVGPVPFNNSPFTGKRNVDPTWQNVAPANRPHLTFLHQALLQVNRLSREDAEKAAALLMHERLSVTRASRQVPLFSNEDAAPVFARLVDAADDFVREDPESGRRGQALVAACLSLAFPQVESGRINDPSRRHPGDVRALRDGHIVVYAEVKQKVVPTAEVDRFVRQLMETDQRVGLYVALANGPHTVPLARPEITAWKWGVVLRVYTSGRKLARDAATWSGLAASELPLRFDRGFARWLVKMGCRDDTVHQWLALRERVTS